MTPIPTSEKGVAPTSCIRRQKQKTNMIHHSYKNNGKAFSLIELLVALSILAVVAAIIVPRFLNVRGQAAATTARAQQQIIQNAVEQFISLGGSCGTATAGPILNFLNTTPPASGPRATALGVSDSAASTFGSSTISLQLNPQATNQASAPASTATSGFYWNAAANGLAWYVDGNGTVRTIAIDGATGAVTFTPAP